MVAIWPTVKPRAIYCKRLAVEAWQYTPNAQRANKGELWTLLVRHPQNRTRIEESKECAEVLPPVQSAQLSIKGAPGLTILARPSSGLIISLERKTTYRALFVISIESAIELKNLRSFRPKRRSSKRSEIYAPQDKDKWLISFSGLGPELSVSTLRVALRASVASRPYAPGCAPT
jgi:hypothetical protein